MQTTIQYQEVLADVRSLRPGDYLIGSKATVVETCSGGYYRPGKFIVTFKRANGDLRSAEWNAKTTMKVERPVTGDVA